MRADHRRAELWQRFARKSKMTALKNQRWKDLYTVLDREGPFTNPGFEAGNDTKELLHSVKLLVIGAGGLGCELLKNLALSGFTDIHCIDMDTIDLSNLNRQFLFRAKDIGKPKAEVAAEFIMQRVPGCVVTPYYGKIQDKDEAYYFQFTLIICGLDSVDARRWINATVVGMYDPDDPSTLRPIIDGGTEGFKGQARLILPRITACYECSLDMQTKPKTFPICTIANTPRLPEHCIEWASVLQFPSAFPDQKVDGDDPVHLQWIFNTALERAIEFSITGVTYTLTQGVVKNIIPAIASTNAIVAASCANEAFKIVTNSSVYIDNYMMYTGDAGVYTYTFQLQKKEECGVCGTARAALTIPSDCTVQGLIDILTERPQFQLKKPSLRSAGGATLYMAAPAALEQKTRGNLTKSVQELCGGGSRGDVTITDANLPISLLVSLTFD